jgi:hypothetical protein
MMKTIVTTLTLAGWVCLQADTPPPAPLVFQTSGSAIAASDDDALELPAIEKGNRTVIHAKSAADQAMRQAHQAMELAHSKMAMAELDVADQPVELQTAIEDGFGFAVAGPGRAATQPLVIRGNDMDSNAVANVQEDLAVMSRILNKAIDREVGREGRDSAMGIVLSALPGSRRPQSIYLEGYGALFLVSVKFPLVPAPAREDDKPEKAVDNTWEQTKREMNGNRIANVRVWNGYGGGDASPDYNSEQVEGLKKELIETMKNAANIRDVKPGEWVTVTVIGSRQGGVTHVKRMSTGSKGKTTARAEVYVADAGRSAPRESTLTLRAKKSDVDAYAKGDIDGDQFKKRVSVAAY